MQGHIYLKSWKLTLNEFLGASVVDIDPRADTHLLSLLKSALAVANNANFRELFCFMTRFELTVIPKCC